METIQRPRTTSDPGGRGMLAAYAVVILACGAAGYALRQPGPRKLSGRPIFAVNEQRPEPVAVRPNTAPAPSSLAGVIAGSGFNAAPAPAAPAPAAGLVAAAKRIASGGVAALPQWSAMIGSPSQFLVNRTYLGSVKDMRRFLSDDRKVRLYAGHPAVYQVISSPLLLKVLLRPSVARAFVGSPAMNDDATVSALMRSSLVSQILQSPAVQEAMTDDPASLQGVMADPQVTQWLGKHPDAVAALGKISPAFSAMGMLGGAAAPR